MFLFICLTNFFQTGELEIGEKVMNVNLNQGFNHRIVTIIVKQNQWWVIG